MINDSKNPNPPQPISIDLTPGTLAPNDPNIFFLQPLQ